MPAPQVLASYGHIRDLPPRQGSVRPDEGFALTWTPSRTSGPRIKDIVDALDGAQVRARGLNMLGFK